MALFRSIPNLEFKSSFGVWEKQSDLRSAAPRSATSGPNVAGSYFENVKIESIGGIDEVQRSRRDRDGELVVQDLTVKLSLEQLGLPGLLQTG